MTHLSTLVEIAAELRSRAGQKSPPFSTTQIIRSCFPNILVTGGKLPPGVDELASNRREGPIIVYARELPGPRQRFVISHGLGHLLFDDERACMQPGRSGVPASEARADLFAAELLAPLEQLRQLVDQIPSDDPESNELYLDHVDELASRFNVSACVIDGQIRRLDLIDNFVSQLRLTNW